MSQESQTEDGNSDTSSLSRNQKYKYDFVINNYSEPELISLKSTLKRICKKAVFGLEVGESGTPHVQGYISLIVKQRITTLHTEPGLERASFRAVRNDAACIAYCQKVNVYFLHGFPKPTRIISELRPWQHTIESLCIQEPDERTINWVYDPVTNNGKSVFTKYMVVKHNAVFFSGGNSKDIACQLALTQDSGRDLNDNLILIFNYGYEHDINYKIFENLKDGLISSPKYKSSALIFNNPHIWIFSNNLPKAEVISQRLGVWKVWQIVDNSLRDVSNE